MHRWIVRFAPLVLVLLASSLRAQTKPAGGVETQAQQQPCLPEDEPCGGGGGTGSVTVAPDDGQLTVYTGIANNVAEFTVTNNYISSYTYSLTCSALGAGTCTAIKNTSGTTITSINLPANGTAAVAVFFTAAASPGSGFVKLTASNGVWSYLGAYAVTVTPPPALVSVTPDSGAVYVGTNTPAPYLFTVTNPGLSSQTYSLTCSIVGAGTCGTVTPSSITLAAGANTSVTVNATSGATNGRVVLTASGPATDAGTYYLTVLPGTPGALTATVAAPSPGPDLDRSACVEVAMGPDAASECGDLVVAHALPAVRTYGRSRVPTLLYNSRSAAPTPIVAANVTIPAGRLNPSTVEVVLRVAGVERARATWNGYDWLTSGPRRVALTYSAVGDTSGIYPYELEVAAIYPSGRYATVLNGDLNVLNRSTSPMGAGWWLAGIEELKIGTTALRWVGGDGSSRRYTLASSSVWVAANRARADTIRYDGTKYLRILPGGGSVQFDATGKHVATVNRTGQTTTMTYNGSGQLSTIAVPKPVGSLTYTFSYTGGFLSAVTAPPIGALARPVVTTVTAGRLVTVKDPDSSTVSLGYGQGNGVITSRTNRLGVVTTYTYVAGFVEGGSVSGMTQSPITAVRNAGRLGLPGASVDTASVFTRIDGPRTDVGDTARIWVDAAGAPLRIVDPNGGQTSIAYGDARWPGLATKVVSPSGRVTTASYDARGLMASQTDSSRSESRIVGDVGVSFYATTRYEYDPKWPVAVKVVPPMGDSVVLAYDATTGNRLWQQDALGTPGRVTYTYNPAGQLASIRQGGVRLDSLTYDGLGNLASRLDAAGFATSIIGDQIGRDTIVTTPIDTMKVFRFTSRSGYDLMGRVTWTRSYGPVIPEGGTDTLEIRTWFNREGLVDSMSRRAIPDENSVGTLVTSYHYDGIGRRILDRAPDGAADSLAYDPAGNLIARRTRRGFFITMDYDALGRLTRRITPSAASQPNTMAKPNAPSGTYVIPADTAIFGYDLAGNMVRADNGSAQVRRSYSPSGQLLDDTLRIRTNAAVSAGGSFTQHEYLIRHTYDLDGRPVALLHPTQLTVGGAGGTESYEYDPVGRLAKLTDMLGAVYRFHYDFLGRRDSLVYPPGNVAEVTTYDVLGQVRQRVAANPNFVGSDSGLIASTYRQETLWHDARGKVTDATALRDTTGLRYNARGPLVRSSFIDETGPTRLHPIEDWGVDALGNVTWHDFRNEDWARERTRSYYEAGTGRQLLLWPEIYDVEHTWNQQYDSAGNQVLLDEGVPNGGIEQGKYFAIPNGLPRYSILKRMVYSADDRLTVHQVTRPFDDMNFSEPSGYFRSFFEEYRYDAMGRRVLRRSRGLYNCTLHDLNDCHNSIERTVYNGDATLWEIRAPGGDTASAATLERDTAQTLGDSRYFGRVGYTNGPALDHPLGLLRIGYGKDYGDGAGFISFGPIAMSIHFNWRGLSDLVIMQNGAAKRCLKYVAGGSQRTRCLEAQWAARGPFLYKQKHPNLYAPSWVGSVALDGEDASGLMFRRNRFYDPTTGRFTQEDPAGLSGGVNLYGFGEGDPVNFTDPFGLSPEGACPPCRDQSAPEGQRLVQEAERQNAMILEEGLVYGRDRSDAGQLDCSGYVCRVLGHPHPAEVRHLATIDMANNPSYRRLAPGEAPQVGDLMLQRYSSGNAHLGMWTGARNKMGGYVGCAMGEETRAACVTIWGIPQARVILGSHFGDYKPWQRFGYGSFDNSIPMEWYRPQVTTGGP